MEEPQESQERIVLAYGECTCCCTAEKLSSGCRRVQGGGRYVEVHAQLITAAAAAAAGVVMAAGDVTVWGGDTRSRDILTGMRHFVLLEFVFDLAL